MSATKEAKMKGGKKPLTEHDLCPECRGILYRNRAGLIECINCGKTFGAASAPVTAAGKGA